MNKSDKFWIEKLDPSYMGTKPGKDRGDGGIECHTPLDEKGGQRTDREEDCPFVVQPDGTIWVRREVIFKAMEESGFKRTDSCCHPELNKMCESDQYKGNLEGFVNRLMKLINVSPS